MLSKSVSIFICLVLLLTTKVDAAIRITEIAWMGNADSQFAEWFELYNDGESSVSLVGWKLYEDAGEQLIFTLTKSIAAKGYLLVERTTTSAPDPVPGIQDESGSFGGSGFSNTGEHLVLKDSQGASIQTLNFLTGWPAGSSESKQTMQWDGDKWVTAVGTPKAAVAGGGVVIPPPVDVKNTGGTAWTAPKIEPRVELVIPKTIYVDVSSEYLAKTYLEYDKAYTGVFLWNMGDGKVYKTTTPVAINHIYKYPGTYTITMAFYKNPYDKKPFLLNSIEREVSASKISFRVIKDKGFEFTNLDSVPIDISGWNIVDEKVLELPAFTIISPKKTIILPFSVFDIKSANTSTILQTPERNNVSFKQEVVTENKTKTQLLPTPLFSRQSEILENNLQAVAAESFTQQIITSDPKEKNTKNKTIIFSIVLFMVIVLFILLERFIGSKEDQ